jgi:dihydrolipoamide dehydrogenase
MVDAMKQRRTLRQAQGRLWGTRIDARRKIGDVAKFSVELELAVADTIFDVVVVGGGPAGYTCAIRASQYGLKAALIDANDRLGGTCLLWGCIPTKAMLFTAEIWDHLKHAGTYGIDGVGEAKLNWKNVLARKDDVITRHTKGLDFLMKKNKITTFKGFGKLTGPAKEGVHTIEVKLADGKTETVKAKKVVLATGSDARMLPGYKADDTILTNYEILKIAEMPKSLVVIGSGAVGVEFASIFKSFGAEVTILEMLPRVVPVEDEEISKELLRLYKKRGIDVNLSIKDTKIEKNKDGALVTWTDANGKAQKKQAEKVLVAVGRSPRTADIGLDKTNIKPDRSFVMTNEWMETTEPGVYAIGDIVGGMPQLAHVGSMAGLVVAARMAGKYAKPVNRARIPGCTYTDPQIASVGLTETQAKEKGYQVKVGKFPFVGNSKATILDAHDGFIKVVADAKYGEILGVHIIGPYATEIIAEAVTALELEATVEEMMFTIHAHPTVAEALLDGFSSVEGKAVNV